MTDRLPHHYSARVLWSDEDELFVATAREFPGISGLGTTEAMAIAELRVAQDLAIESLVESGESLPDPYQVRQFSGQFRLRLPQRLHAELAELAEDEGTSLNTLVVQLVERGLGSRGKGESARSQVPAHAVTGLIGQAGTQSLFESYLGAWSQLGRLQMDCTSVDYSASKKQTLLGSSRLKSDVDWKLGELEPTERSKRRA